MKSSLLTITICLMAISTIFSKSKANEMNTIVLVHGAWMDASAWDLVTPVLQKAGYEVIVVNLPGHGKDNTPAQTLTMQSYVDAVKNAIGSKTNIVLVGHSMGGMVISATAEQMPNQIKKVLYVGAFLPANGQSLLQLAQDAESLLGPSIVPSADQLNLDVKHDNITSIFFADATEDIKKSMLTNFKVEPAIPFTNALVLTEANFGAAQKVMIYTTNDKANSFTNQKLMAKNSSNVINTYEIASSHSPFFSMPNDLADIIIKEAK